MWFCGFYRYEQVYTNRRQEFQNVLESYAIALDSFYLFTKKFEELKELYMVLIRLIHYAVCIH